MATKIRLQRHGKKSRAFYHIVAADTRAPRNGKFIEKLGTYNPNTNPATIDIDFERTLSWVQVGAEMTDTARALLSYKGVLHKNHLIKGVAKGALTEAQVEDKFTKWMEEKEGKISTKATGLEKDATKAKADALKAESEVSAARAKEIEAKNTPVEEVVEVTAEEAPVAETAEAKVEEAPVVEEATPVAETAEAKVEEAPVVEEATPVDETAEAKVEETPVVEETTPEAKTEEAPKVEAKEDEQPTEEEAKPEEPKA